MSCSSYWSMFRFMMSIQGPRSRSNAWTSSTANATNAIRGNSQYNIFTVRYDLVLYFKENKLHSYYNNSHVLWNSVLDWLYRSQDYHAETDREITSTFILSFKTKSIKKLHYLCQQLIHYMYFCNIGTVTTSMNSQFLNLSLTPFPFFV